MSLHIRKLISLGENQQLDFKFGITDSKKLAKTLVAFSNTDGGRLLIGVKDNGVIAGVRTEEEFYMVQSAAELYSKPEIYFETNTYSVDGKMVMEIIIPPSKQVPHFAVDENGKWLAYIRVKDQNILANSVMLKVWNKRNFEVGSKIKYSDKVKALLFYLNENKTITLSKFCRIAFISRKEAEKILVDLISTQVIEIVFTDKDTYYQLVDVNKIEKLSF